MMSVECLEKPIIVGTSVRPPAHPPALPLMPSPDHRHHLRPASRSLPHSPVPASPLCANACRSTTWRGPLGDSSLRARRPSWGRSRAWCLVTSEGRRRRRGRVAARPRARARGCCRAVCAVLAATRCPLPCPPNLVAKFGTEVCEPHARAASLLLNGSSLPSRWCDRTKDANGGRSTINRQPEHKGSHQNQQPTSAAPSTPNTPSIPRIYIPFTAIMEQIAQSVSITTHTSAPPPAQRGATSTAASWSAQR